jgi:RNA polymerase subunit RPABC4/transcription elongation factor Spt4
MKDKYNLNSHKQTRQILRVLGPIILIIGILFIISGTRSFFEMGNQTPSNYFGDSTSGDNFDHAFIGMPLVFVGAVMSMFGYMGKVARYQASELAPVGKDVANYMMDHTRESAREFAGAIGEGLKQGRQSPPIEKHCGSCGSTVDEDSQFCDQCGNQVVKVCITCGTDNESDAKFCDACGNRF